MITTKLTERYCFTFCGREYVFRNKELFRQEYFDKKNKRTYYERKIRRTGGGYYLQGLYMSDKAIKKIIELRQVPEIVDDGVPF